jgi:predicted GH43/DUF377 family glycosyl hydrolase
MLPTFARCPPKEATTMKLQRYAGNPILRPNPQNAWEALVTTNPGAWYDADAGQVILIYRAAGNDYLHRISLGLATSTNGYDFVRASDRPFFTTSEEGHWDAGSVEDARVVKFDDWYFITYAAVPVLPGQYWLNAGGRFQLPEQSPAFPIGLRENWTRTGLLLTKDFQTVYRAGYLTDPTVDDRDVIIFPEKVNNQFVTLHRPMQWCGSSFPCREPSIWIAFSDDLLAHKELRLLAQPEREWEASKVGGAAPPLRTPDGWLTLYHAVGADNRYRVGAMLLDLYEPTCILARTPEPIYEPQAPYEMEGIYKGITFPCGNVIIDGTLFVYYGGADQYCGVATCALDDLLAYLRTCPPGAGTR